MTPTRPVVLAVCALLCLCGCGGEERPAPAPAASEPQPTLRIGLIPEQNIFRQLERYEPLAAYLSDRIDVDIELKILPRYGNIVNNFKSENLDGAFFGSFTYALAHERVGVSVLARPVNIDGRSTYHGLVFVRTDSGIDGVEGMRGKRFAFVDKATTAGYLLPLDYFFTHGVDDYRTFLGETYFAGTHEDTIYDVLYRKAYIGAAKNTVFDRIAIVDRSLEEELTVLARSPDVPENALALSRETDASVRDLIQRTLLSMHDDAEGKRVLERFGALRFIETNDEDYEPVYRYAADIGLELSSYDYTNH